METITGSIADKNNNVQCISQLHLYTIVLLCNELVDVWLKRKGHGLNASIQALDPLVGWTCGEGILKGIVFDIPPKILIFVF
jgi:hypothetical protein